MPDSIRLEKPCSRPFLGLCCICVVAQSCLAITKSLRHALVEHNQTVAVQFVRYFLGVKGVAQFLLLLMAIGCRSLPPGVRYEGGDGRTPETAVVIEGAKSEKELIFAVQQWIRKKFPHAIIEDRAIEFDPLTGYSIDQTLGVRSIGSPCRSARRLHGRCC